MRKPKVKKVLLGLFAALLIPTSAFAAEDGVFTQVGSPSIIKYYTGGGKYSTGYWNSTGGSFRLCSKAVDKSDNTVRVKLYEWDPDGNHDYVTEGWVTGNNCVTFLNLDSVKDGSDNDAELFGTYDFADYYDSSVSVYAYD